MRGEAAAAAENARRLTAKVLERRIISMTNYIIAISINRHITTASFAPHDARSDGRIDVWLFVLFCSHFITDPKQKSVMGLAMAIYLMSYSS
jgi:hypothetical protein